MNRIIIKSLHSNGKEGGCVAVYYGRGGKRYDLGNKLGDGGEGTVYLINNHPGSVAKIYKPERLKMPGARQEMKEKIEAMLASPVCPYVKGVLTVAWPTDYLVDGNKQFQGFVMPAVENKKSLLWACRESERRQLFGGKYQWRVSVAIAFNLALAVDNLHRAGIIIGDLNPNNIMVSDKGLVTLIDADSFNITSKSGKVYKCSVGMEEVLPAELQGKDLAKPCNAFTYASDRFALAVHIFNLLLNNCHPFGCLDLNSPNSSAGKNPRVHNITKGFCPYVDSGKGKVNASAPDMAMLPMEIRDLFDRAFKYTSRTAVRKETLDRRPSAEEWKNALWKLYNTQMITCRSDKYHVYPAQYKACCPWCQVQVNTGQKNIRAAGKRGPHPIYRQKAAAFLKNRPASGTIPVTSPAFMNTALTNTRYNRREAWPLFALCMAVGAIGAALPCRYLSGEINRAFNMQTGAAIIGVIVGILGLICGYLIAKRAEPHYRTAANGWPWLCTSLAAPAGSWIMVFLGALALSLVASVLVVIIFIVIAVGAASSW